MSLISGFEASSSFRSAKRPLPSTSASATTKGRRPRRPRCSLIAELGGRAILEAAHIEV